MLTLSDGFKVPDAPAPHRQVVDSKGNTGKKPNYGGPDGLKVDREGNLFAVRPGGINVFAPDATLLGSIEIGGPTSNCAWDPLTEDGSVLYITADTAVYRIALRTKGSGL